MIQTTWSDMTASLQHGLGIHLYTTNGGSFMNVGMPPTREKGSHLPPRTTKVCNLRNGHDSITAPSVKPDLGSSSRYEGCCSVKPTLSGPPRDGKKCDSSTPSGGGTGTLDKQVDLHHASDLSHPRDSLLMH